MKAYQKIQAIQGLITDFRERYFYQASQSKNPEQMNWTEADIKTESAKVLAGVKQVLEMKDESESKG